MRRRRSAARLVTLGTFDGVHRGHGKLVRSLLRLAARRRLRSLVVLFERPPRFHFRPESSTPLLTLPRERERLLRSLGVDRVETLRFGPRWAAMSHENFFEGYLLRRLGAAGLLVGPDFAFGRGRLGDVAWLRSACRSRGLSLWVGPLLRARGRKISSTRIRELVSAGRVEDAARLLGRPYSLEGRVTRGRGLGRKLGFPTANLRVDPGKLLPRGVFQVRARLPGSARARPGVCNVGTRPSAGGGPLSVEVHLPGFSGDLYGCVLGVEFLRRLRSERKFPSLEALKRQIARDVRGVALQK